MYHWKHRKTNSGNIALSYENDFHDSYGNIIRCSCKECNGRVKAELTHFVTFEKEFFDSWSAAAKWLIKSVAWCDERIDID